MSAAAPVSSLRCPQLHLHLPYTASPASYRINYPPLFLTPCLAFPPSIQPSQRVQRTLRPLSTTCSRLKASGGKNKSNISRAEAKTASTNKDPFDFTEYETTIAQAHETLKAALAKVSVVALDAETVEALRVNIGDAKSGDNGGAKGGGKGPARRRGEAAGEKMGSGGGHGTVTVGDVASVMKRGRNIVVMVGEKEYLKPVLSTLQTSSSSISPQTTPTEPLHITLPIPPTTAESRQAAAKSASEKGEHANLALNQARAAQKKRLRAMFLAREVGPDDLKRAEKKMEEANQKAGETVKKLVEEGKRRVERG